MTPSTRPVRALHAATRSRRGHARGDVHAPRTGETARADGPAHRARRGPTAPRRKPRQRTFTVTASDQADAARGGPDGRPERRRAEYGNVEDYDVYLSYKEADGSAAAGRHRAQRRAARRRADLGRRPAGRAHRPRPAGAADRRTSRRWASTWLQDRQPRGRGLDLDARRVRAVRREQDVVTTSGETEAWTLTCESRRRQDRLRDARRLHRPRRAVDPEPRLRRHAAAAEAASRQAEGQATKARSRGKKRAACVKKAKKLEAPKKRKAAQSELQAHLQAPGAPDPLELARRRMPDRGWRTRSAPRSARR